MGRLLKRHLAGYEKEKEVEQDNEKGPEQNSEAVKPCPQPKKSKS